MSKRYQLEAESILRFLATVDFEACYPLSRDFEEVPPNAGFYAFRHRERILYIGIGANLRRRFRNGHKALSWAFVDRLNPEEVRIAIELMGRRTPEEIQEIERLMIKSARPPYNSR